MPGKPRFRPDPPHVIARNMATAHLLRDPLYGRFVPWETGTGKDRNAQQQRWAFIWRNFASQPPLYSHTELIGMAEDFARRFGVATDTGAAADEALRQRFRTFLKQEAARLGLKERMDARPAPLISRRRKDAVIETVRKIELAESFKERKERMLAQGRAYYHRRYKARYHDPALDVRARRLATSKRWATRNPEKVRANLVRFHAKNPGKSAEYQRRSEERRKAAGLVRPPLTEAQRERQRLRQRAFHERRKAQRALVGAS